MIERGLAAEKGNAARSANRVLRVGLIEAQAILSQLIEVWGNGLVVTRAAHQSGVVLIGQDEEDVWPSFRVIIIQKFITVTLLAIC